MTRPGVTDAIAVTFIAGGTACLHTVDGVSVGTWVPTGRTTFTFRIREALIVNHQQTGWVQINQNAVLSYHSFTSSGVSDLTDLTGNPIGASAAQISATLNKATQPC